MMAQQVLEAAVDDASLLVNAPIEGHRLSIVAQAGLQVAVHACRARCSCLSKHYMEHRSNIRI